MNPIKANPATAIPTTAGVGKPVESGSDLTVVGPTRLSVEEEEGYHVILPNADDAEEEEEEEKEEEEEETRIEEEDDEGINVKSEVV
jgi:hypothetical protein